VKRLADYSQYFLRSPDLIKELIGHTSIRKNDTVLDIGAGSGAITAVLARKVRWVVAIEAEPRMAEKLADNMKRYPNVTVESGDFLSMPLPTAPYKIFSNIPFHISSPIIRKLADAPLPPTAAFIIVQKQFARKLLMSDQHFTGQLGAVITPWFTVRIRRPLRRTDYFPHPNVDTVLMELKPRQEPLLPRSEQPAYDAFVTKCFADYLFFKKQARTKAAISADLLPSQLSAEQWVSLYRLS
jgi:23S rRNA (adenine-N6)-dimethyltransferase